MDTTTCHLCFCPIATGGFVAHLPRCTWSKDEAATLRSELEGSRLLRMRWQLRAEKAEAEVAELRQQMTTMIAPVDVEAQLQAAKESESFHPWNWAVLVAQLQKEIGFLIKRVEPRSRCDAGADIPGGGAA